MSLSDSAITTLTEAKKYLKVDNTDNDTIIELMIETATKKTEDHCNSFWVKREITETHIGDGKQFLYLYRQPIVEIASVTIDGEDEEDYIGRLSRGLLYLSSGWPLGAEVEVVYTAGYLDEADDALIEIPDAVLAVLACLGEWYNNPQGVASESVSGIGSVTYNTEMELPASAKAKLTSLRKGLL